ncbi:hypothetical protein ACI79C_18935 [Geodermatophilus sp. SYSU D00697]
MTSAGLHVLALAGSAAAPPERLLVLAGMGMACLPCALHLALLPRRRTWVQMAVVSAAMLVAHPWVTGGHGAGAHGATSSVVGAAMVAVAACGLALALWALVLGARIPRTVR